MRNADFTDVLDAACRSAGLDLNGTSAADGPRRMHGTAAHLKQLADQILELAARTSLAMNALDSYFEHQSERPAKRNAKLSDPQAVANELHITARMSSADLTRLRREFALANHPDRAQSAEREHATRRMMIANMIIDEELKRRHAVHPDRKP